MFLPSFRLDGKIAIVTGAGRGIGKAIAIGFAEAGANVAILSRTVEQLEETARSIEQLDRRAYIIPTDITDREAVKNAVAEVIKQAGKVDILVNNAGMNIRTAALEVTDAEWETIMNTNLKSAFMMSQEVGAVMKKQGTGGKFINIASVAGHVALRTGVAYAASKAALIQMTKVLAFEWGKFGIQVNAIGPWYFQTPLTEKLLQNQEYVNDILAVTPLKRIGQLPELVGPAVFLASDAGNYVTGQTLFVDGGMTIHGF
ncbi:glucose 1-dehydrogenase [Anoxybacillus rupiensis]|jgi:NAD(P)-dependent dehydrogenase (short-subunit alcohol dehydrogenase family)|uniref:Glucose 1-dehydrogenase n=1 Tax=Anoxybacteroides rupiense TaxID=311460 RepID=A0ABT5W2A6_9BACL|nr:MULTISPECIES: glucose 1-dehydrogenase [Anoxybacillus]MBS2770233.1 glucose 1-dehydrogenase [Anoxybacillus rupiensis]MDE8562391.1 glucose 1-dehydrogenase [Anoxybacillus rupiensis]QHC04580.1 glucose 1-dehydrogenase [Anoxybacillus sp. PDR2]